MKKYKCADCGGLCNKIGTIYDYKEGDYSKCLICGAIEPGFTEVEVEDGRSEL